MNLIDSHGSLQSSHSCKLNTVAWVVELTYFLVIVKCESLLGGYGKVRCTVRAFAADDCLWPTNVCVLPFEFCHQVFQSGSLKWPSARNKRDKLIVISSHEVSWCI